MPVTVGGSRREVGRWREQEDEATRDLPRLFVAVPLGEEARDAVARLVSDVQASAEAAARAQRSPVRWVRMDGLHVTLRFLGPTPEDKVAELSAIVDDAAASGAPFGVSIRGSGAFPSARRPRTLWLGIDKGSVQLAALARRLSDGLAKAGWPTDDRPFNAHLTLARADGRREGPAVADMLSARASGFETEFLSDELVLYESVTGGGPARYVSRHAALLGG
ncbi:MAG: RNA 2',3'-cyclic phosphodiesterase [Chloroflexota bacterium]|nr:RNA 2',3'-cyclic phosphodiesterase [Chloroflexota bacterium]